MKRTYRILLALLAALLTASAALAEDYPLLDRAGSQAARVLPAEDLAVLPQTPIPGSTPEYYFRPTDGFEDVRFYYYTTGEGEPRALAEAALENYAIFYDDFTAGAISDAPLADRACLRFSYTCGYLGPDGESMVYEQTAVAYLPLGDDEFIACIVSLGFTGGDDFWAEASLTALLSDIVERVQMG